MSTVTAIDYNTKPASEDDSDQFISAAIDALDKDQAEGKGEFAKNVFEVAEWAVQVDESFASVTYGLKDMNDKYGVDFPLLGTFNNEWRGYNQRWSEHLQKSRDVASEHAAILNRFDQVFLEMVQSIETDQDRKDAILELEAFANKPHGESQEMAKGFRILKEDIEGFIVRFEAWIKTTETELKEQAEKLKAKIEGIKKELDQLDIEIIAATAALLASAAALETLVSVIGLVAAAITLAVLVAKRVDKTIELIEARKDLDEVNRKQEALAHIKTQFDGLKPDIALICEKLALFGDIWDSVKSQTKAFQEQLQKGLDVVSNKRFKQEVRLARKLCAPLRNGLIKYATELESHSKGATEGTS